MDGVCCMQLLLVLTSAVILGSGSEPYCTRFEAFSTWRARPLYVYPPGTGWLSYTPQTLGYLHFVSYDSQGYSGIRTQFHPGTERLKLKLNYERWSVSLGVRHPSGTRDQFFFLLEIFFRQLRVCYFVAPSLTRGRVCNLMLLLVLASAFPLGSEPRGTQDHILLSQFLRLPQPGDPGSRIYIPQEQGGSVISPGTGFPFCHLLRLAGLRRRYSNPPPHGS
jgi:hypothetical protein